jgi:hypothetical protein
VENKSVYALLIGVGDYEKINIKNLPTYRMDLSLLATSLLVGLKVPRDNLRLMAGENNNGYITTTDLARAIADFKSLLGSEDTFIFYFSGHGRDKNLIFSNGQVELQSVVDYVGELPSKNKIIILDCCYSGNFKTEGARTMHFDDSIDSFAGRGIAVLASSSADEVSRLGPNGNHSMFTGALSTSIAMRRKVRKGKVSLQDIYDNTLQLVNEWNRQNPGKEQQPIYRTSMGGTIFFCVEEYRPYEKMEVSFETELYAVSNVEPLSSKSVKRLCAFVVLKQKTELESLSRITREIAERIKYAEVYSTKANEASFERMPARAIWCYFGYDESDMLNHRYYAYTIWAADDEMKNINFKSSKNAIVIDDIYVFENKSYNLLRKMQEPTHSRDEFIASNRRTMAIIVNLAEKFIVDLQEVVNQTISIEEMQEKYGDWIGKVRRNYFRLTDGDITPDDLHDWTEEITNLTGWVLDLSILIENKKGNGEIGDKEKWLIDNAVRHYRESMERIKQIEEYIDW